MTDATKVAAIAAGLTKAQRDEVQHASPTEWKPALHPSGSAASIAGPLLSRVSRQVIGGRKHSVYRLTPLGLAVADYLKQEQQ